MRRNPSRYRKAKAAFKRRLFTRRDAEIRAFVSVMKEFDIEFPEASHGQDLLFGDMVDYIARGVLIQKGSAIDAEDLMTSKALKWYRKHESRLPALSIREGIYVSLALAGSTRASTHLENSGYEEVDAAFDAALPKKKSPTRAR